MAQINRDVKLFKTDEDYKNVFAHLIYFGDLIIKCLKRFRQKL
jgi:hypothetical protein